jgi:hypothetical protein
VGLKRLWFGADDLAVARFLITRRNGYLVYEGTGIRR